MLTIIESGSNAWALAATDGDLRIYSREQAGEWNEVPLSEDTEQIDQDGSLILEALYEQRTGQEPDGDMQEPEAEPEADADEEDEGLEEDEEPEEPQEDEEPEEDEEPKAEEEEEPPEEEEQKPRRRRAKTTASRGRSRAKK